MKISTEKSTGRALSLLKVFNEFSGVFASISSLFYTLKMYQFSSLVSMLHLQAN